MAGCHGLNDTFSTRGFRQLRNTRAVPGHCCFLSHEPVARGPRYKLAVDMKRVLSQPKDGFGAPVPLERRQSQGEALLRSFSLAVTSTEFPLAELETESQRIDDEEDELRALALESLSAALGRPCSFASHHQHEIPVGHTVAPVVCSQGSGLAGRCR